VFVAVQFPFPSETRRNDPAHINTRKFPIDPPATLNLEAPKSSVYGLTLASGHIRAGMANIGASLLSPDEFDIETTDSTDDAQPCPDRTLGAVLMRSGVALSG
jgi:hypothetical protein